MYLVVYGIDFNITHTNEVQLMIEVYGENVVNNNLTYELKLLLEGPSNIQVGSRKVNHTDIGEVCNICN